jgi:hypothetical protein
MKLGISADALRNRLFYELYCRHVLDYKILFYNSSTLIIQLHIALMLMRMAKGGSSIRRHELAWRQFTNFQKPLHEP